MANLRAGTLQFIDSAGELSTDSNLKIAHVILTSTGANAVLLLADSDSNDILEFRLGTSGETKHYYFEVSPLVFPKGLRAKTVTNCKATLAFTSKGSSA